MKPLSSAAETRRYSAAQTAIWMLTLTDLAPVTPETFRAANLAISFDDDDYPAMISATPEWEMKSWREFGPGGIVGSKARVRLADLNAGLSTWLGERNALGLSAELRLLQLESSGSFDVEDAVTMLKGIVVEVEREAAAITLTLHDPITVLESHRVARALNLIMTEGESSPLIGHILPIVIGRHEELELEELRPGIVGVLASDISSSATVIPLVSIADFPTSGVVQIGAEQISYSTVSTANQTLGTVASPATRGGSPTAHSEGDPVRLVPAGGFQWLVADHLCASVTNLEADGVPVSSSAWSLEVRALGDEDAHVVEMNAWPVAFGKQARTLTANVQGWPDGLGGCLENPADVIELFLTQPRFGGLASGDLDSTSLDAIWDELDAAGFAYARRITSELMLGEAVDSAARECAVWIRSGGSKVNFSRVAAELDSGDALETLDDTKALDADTSVILRPVSGSFRIGDALELYIPAISGRDERVVWTEYASPAPTSGIIPARIRLDWLDGLSEDALDEIGERLWYFRRELLRRHEQSFPLGSIMLEPGDVALLDAPPLGLDEVPTWIESLAMKTANRIEVRFKIGIGE